ARSITCVLRLAALEPLGPCRPRSPARYGWFRWDSHARLRGRLGSQCAVEADGRREAEEGDRGDQEEGRGGLVDEEAGGGGDGEAAEVARHPDEPGRGALGLDGVAFGQFERDGQRGQQLPRSTFATNPEARRRRGTSAVRAVPE